MTRYSVQDVADVFYPPKERRDSHVYGNVKSVNADGSYQVQLNASGVATRCARLCDADAGDRVLVLVQGSGQCAAIGRVGGSAGSMPMIDAVYPVGIYVYTDNGTSPGAWIPNTTWERVMGRFLYGASDDRFLGNEQGEATHTLTYAEMPSHSHWEDRSAMRWAPGYGNGSMPSGGDIGAHAFDGGAKTTSSEGGGAAHNNMPPYRDVAIWRRIA